MKTEELQNPTLARYYIDGKIIYRDSNGIFSFTAAARGLFIWGSAEEFSNTSAPLPDKLLARIDKLDALQADISARCSALHLISTGTVDKVPTLLLVSDGNPRCVAEIARDELLQIDLVRLAEDMETEPHPRGMEAPFLVLVDSPFYAFI